MRTFQFVQFGLCSALVFPAIALAAGTIYAEEAHPRKIVLIAGDPDGHPANTHEYAKSVALIQHCLETSPNTKGFKVESHTGGWPKDERTLDTADTIVLVTSGSDRVETNHPLLVGNRLLAVEKQMNRGCGLMTFHYSTFAPNRIGQRMLEWVGGYFDYQSGPAANGWYSKIQFWNAEAKLPSPDHPVSRGVKPFQVNEEFYYNIRFLDQDERLTPIIHVTPPGETQAFTVGWAVERRNGARGFGFTGGHPFENWQNQDFRKLILNAICWTAHVEVPEAGVQSEIQNDNGAIKVAIVTGQQYPGHPWRETTLALEDAFRKDPRLAVSSIPDIEFLASPQLGEYQVVVLNYCNWESPGLSDAAKANFTRYLQNGGGLVIVHFTNGAWHYSLPNNPDTDWPEWRTKICRRVWDHDGTRQPGDKKSQHDAYGPFRVEICKADHPITQGMEAFETTDELYFDQQGSEPIEVLATARSKISGQDAPMAFVYEYGKGKVFQTVLGHDAAALQTLGTAQLVRRGTLWAAGAKLDVADKLDRPSVTDAAEGRFGRALDARRGGLAIKPNAAYHTPPWTIECWAKLEPRGFNILVAQSAKESDKHWELFTWNDDGSLTAYLPGCTPDHVRSTAKVTDGRWHYLAMTFDGRQAQLFVDGKVVAEAQIKCHEGRGSTGPLWIGAYPPGGIGCNGLIDEVRLSKTIRNIEQVPSERFAVDDQTIGLWRFDDAPELPVIDESSLKADAVSLSASEPTKPADDHFFGWQETEGHDDRWQKTDTGRFFSGTIRKQDQVTARALCIRVGNDREAALMYDTSQMQVACAWTGNFLNFDPGRFGLIGMPSVAGQTVDIAKQLWLLDGKPHLPIYRGLYLHRDRVVLAYEIGELRVLESPWLETRDGKVLFTRSFEITPHKVELKCLLGDSIAFCLPPNDQTDRVTVNLLGGDRSEVLHDVENLSQLTEPGPPRWNAPIVTQGRRGEDDSPYVVDTLTLPYENPYHALLFTSGFDFFANGDAAVCTSHGDVWLVSGIDDKLQQLRWKRFATGLYQPLGLKIVADQVYVLGRDQITRLHDGNSDGEADFYENFNSDSPTSAGGHDYSTCLETDSAGNFYFLHAIDGLVQISPDGKQRKIIATGFRNPNGMGIGPNDEITVSPQEGNWTPASSIIAVKPGGYYGFGGPKITPDRPLGYDPPLVWLPRPLDNSSGGQVWATSDHFGPLGNKLLHLSYGRSSMLLVLRDEVNGIKQGAVVPLPLQFGSGIMRGRMNPKDGQLYVVGQQGWVSNAVSDGCFERVRYASKAAQLPVGIRYHEDGIAVTFAHPLERLDYEEAGRYRVEQWQYHYWSEYGSADYKVSAKREEGHDELTIRAARVLDDGKTVFLAIDDLRPTMQIQLTFPDDAGQYYSFGTTLAGTIHQLHPRLFATPLEPVASDKAVSPEFEARLQDGLMVEYFTAAAKNGEPRTAVDVAVSQLAAMHASAAERTRPWRPKPWKFARFSGYIRAPVSGQYLLQSNADRVRLAINGQSVQGNGEGDYSVRLSKGLNPLEIEFAAAEDGASRFALDWSASQFRREPIPPTALCHDPTKSPLPQFDELRRGRQIFADQMCVRCHAPASWPDRPMIELGKTGPSLAGIASIRNREWLMDAHRNLHVSYFPDSDAGKRAMADVQAYLETLHLPELAETGGDSDELAAEGGEYFERLGCIACHTATTIDETASAQLTALDSVTAKYKPGALKAYLMQPHQRDRWGKMPDFLLSEREASALVAYLASEASTVSVTLSDLSGDAERGKLAFRARCAHCHATDTIASEPQSIPVFGSKSLRGCLALEKSDRGDAPVYAFELDERKALASFLATSADALGGDTVADAAYRLRKQYQCSACHSQGNQRGKLAESVLELGTTGLPPDRIPNLTWAGEKLRVDWMERLIAGRVQHRARPWFDTRMPVFPPAVAHTIAHGMAAEHGLPAVDPPFTPDPELVEFGRKLSEKNGGLDCRQCHSLDHITPRQPNDAQGISFLHIRERVRRGYYDRWMRDPLRIDPATKMPKFAPDGQHTVLKGIFEGNAARQYEALWHYLQSVSEPGDAKATTGPITSAFSEARDSAAD